MDSDQRVEAASFRYLIANSAIPLIGSATGSVLIAISQIQSGNNQPALIWLCCVYVTVVVRIWLTKRCRTQLLHHGYNSAEALRYAATTAFTGVAWGSVVLLLPDASPLAYVIAISITQAMIMGAVVTHGVFLPSFLAFSLPAMLPMIVLFAISGGTENIVLGLYSAAFLALMIGIAVRFNRSMRNTWLLRFENDDLVTALTAAHDHLAVQAKSDGLTGIANRRRFDEVLETEFARLRRSGEPLSLIFLDVDDFKAYNDTYGHIEGDQCLKNIAAMLPTLLLRVPDLAARYGGEEFAIILPETDHVGAVTLGENIRIAIAGMCIPHAASRVEKHVTVSLGVVTLDCRVTASPSAALAMADRQLYLAKASGRNRIASLDTLETPQSRLPQKPDMTANANGL